MAENVNEHVPASGVETTDRGMFDFMKKKEEKEEQKSNLETEFNQKVQISEAEYKKEGEGEEEKKHGGLLEKLHRSGSSSSSSSEEEGDDEEKKKRKREKKEKKGLKEKVKEKLPGHKSEEDTHVPIVHEVVHSEPSHPEDQEKKGFVDKIKDKLPGHKKVDEHHETVAPVAPVVAEPCVETEGKDKKGFLDKIKEKIPGFSSKTGEEKKEYEEK